jgi:hypothetical protein
VIERPKAWRERHSKEDESVRCCWVCGKRGGEGFTTALRLMGYQMKPGEMGYAHPNCIHASNSKSARKRHTS